LILDVDISMTGRMPSTEMTLAAMRREMRPLLEEAIAGVLLLVSSVITDVERQQTLVSIRLAMRPLLETAMAKGVLAKARDVLDEVEQQRAKGLVEIAEERNSMLTAVAKERATALAYVDLKRAELTRDIKNMQTHVEQQEGHVELNIGGYRYQTSVQTLRRVPSFFDAYFSGRYAQDVCSDGSIFVDRDGEHFGHVLAYMRDGVVAVAEPGVRPSVILLRALKREFGFYCIELPMEEPVEPAEPAQPEVVYALGGNVSGYTLSSMERYGASSGQWSATAAMSTARHSLGACVVAGELYVTGGHGGQYRLASVEKYSPSTDTWTVVAPLPTARSHHAVVVVGSAMYVLGGYVDPPRNPSEPWKQRNTAETASVLKYDTLQGAWSVVALMPHRSCFAVCSVGRDIYIFGGGDARFNKQASVFMFDTDTNEWSTLPPMPFACYCHSASVLDGKVYIVGASDSGHEVLRFDPESVAWSTLAPTLQSRQSGASFVVGGCLYAAGGGAPTTSSSAERYDVASNTWIAVANMREGRSLHCAVTIGSAGPSEEPDLFDTLIAKAARRGMSTQGLA
jgi:hypothetical protein